MAKLTPSQRAYWFFYKHAGFSYQPDTETRRAGRARCAAALARAERDGSALGFTFEWFDDWTVGDHEKEFGAVYANGGPATCESCVCYNGEGEVVASLHCIDDATREYRRVVEAELASEAL
jgi:hypothetical protein